MSTVILSGYISVPESELRQVKAALPEHTSLTRAESGCLVFKVTESLHDKTRFDVYEEFENQAAFTLHQQRVATSPMGRLHEKRNTTLRY